MTDSTLAKRSGQSAVKLVWVLAGTGLCAGVLLLICVNRALLQIQASHAQLADMRSKSSSVSSTVNTFIDTMQSEQVRLLDDNAPPVGDRIELAAIVASLEAIRRAPGTQDSSASIDGLIVRCRDLYDVTRQCEAWAADNQANAGMFTATRKKLLKLETDMRTLVTATDGRRNLGLILKIRRALSKPETDAAAHTRDILTDLKMSNGAEELRESVAEIALLLEQLSACESADSLTDFKDNLISPAIQRLNRAIGEMDSADTEFSKSMNALVAEFCKTLWGNAWQFDNAHQALVTSNDGLYSCCNRKLQLGALKKRLRTAMLEQIERVNAADEELEHRFSSTSIQQETVSEQAIVNARGLMAVVGLFAAAFFFFLASRIANSIRLQIRENEDASASLDAAKREAQLKSHVESERQKLQSDADSILVVVKAATRGDLSRTVNVRGSSAVGQLGEGIESLIRDFNSTMVLIAESATCLAVSSGNVSATAQQMASNSEATSTQANSVSNATAQISENIKTVLARTEEMSTSIRAIATNANRSAKVASNAVQVSDASTTTIATLGESSAEIGNILKVITSIASQTNLLALNATIEAARAGEAGKGFAVVASEVKELAKETTRAAEDIRKKIAAIQNDAKGAIAANKNIGSIVNEINAISNSIANAVEEQTMTTNAIAQNVREAATCIDEIVRNITGVAEVAEETNSGAGATEKAAGSLSQMAADLQRLVGQFKLKTHDVIHVERRSSRAANHAAMSDASGLGYGISASPISDLRSTTPVAR